MSELIIKAIGLGLLLSLLPGPAFFILLQTSIKNGIKSAMAFDFGVLVADVIYIVIAFLFFAQVQALADQKDYLTFAGGIIFSVFGLLFFIKRPAFFRKKRKEVPKEHIEGDGYVFLFLKGLFLNGFNPGVILYWLSVITIGTDEVDASGNSMIWFLSIILITFFSIDALKILGANSLQKFITPKFLKNLNRLVGFAFLVMGVVSITMGLRGIL